MRTWLFGTIILCGMPAPFLGEESDRETNSPERWYRTLADDHAPPKQWLQAASNLIVPEDVEILSTTSLYAINWMTVPVRRPGQMPKMRGESLRRYQIPSVAGLLSKRIETLSTYGLDQIFRMHDACHMTIYLAEWDLPAALPILRVQTRRCRDLHARSSRKDDWTHQILARYISIFTLYRSKGKDADALDEYAHWLRQETIEQVGGYVNDVFEPMIQYPDHPAVVETARWLFQREESPWRDYLLKGTNKTAGLLEEPMVVVEGFRHRVLDDLSSEQRIGTVEIRREGQLVIQMDADWGYGTSSSADADPLAAPSGTTMPIRLCDFVAWKLSRFDGTPRFEIYWPEDKRNQSIGDLTSFLLRYSSRYRRSLPPPFMRRDTVDAWPRMTFPNRENPATPEEVENGLAVFSLSGPEEKRVWKMPAFPMEAKWTTLKDHPRVGRWYVAGNPIQQKRIDYEQDGRVWQAEEVFRDGQWRRYYGFVGRYNLAQVPAEEIEFPASSYHVWKPLSGGVDCRVVAPTVSEDKWWSSVGGLELDQPLIVTVKLRNRLGVETKVPASFYRGADSGGPAFRTGIDVQLEYAPGPVKTGLLAHYYRNEATEKEYQRDWQPLPAIKTTRFESEAKGRVLSPVDEVEAFRFDVRDWYRISQPGAYRLRLIFGGGASVEGESHEVVFSFGEEAKTQGAAAVDPKDVPEWFHHDPDDAHRIFDAWKNLTTREAALYRGSCWPVLAGVLRDERGQPVPVAPLSYSYSDEIRGYHATVRTDSNGYFLIYGPFSLDIPDPGEGKGWSPGLHGIAACPGYPFSDAGFAYAQSKREMKGCELKGIVRQSERVFLFLECSAKHTFDPEGFRQFQESRLEEEKKALREPWRDRPRRPEPKNPGKERKETKTYRIQLLSEEGQPIAKAILKCTLIESRVESGVVVVETDETGSCILEEPALTEQELEDYKRTWGGIHRMLMVDAPGFGVGPVKCEWRTDRINVIRLKKPARVSGALLDWNGNPIWADVQVHYQEPIWSAFELEARLLPDGSFSFDRTMPDEPIQIRSSGISRQSNPIAPVQSEFLTLKAGEDRKDIRLVVPLASAIRGIVLDTEGRPVTKLRSGALWTDIPGEGDRSVQLDERGGFGISGLGQLPYRLEIEAHGFEPYRAEGIRLEPGELRFFRIVLTSKLES